MQSSTAERRRLEMAEKRAKLAALRKAREDREAALASSRASPAVTRPPSTAGERPASSASRNDEIDNLLRGVGVGGGLRESVLGRSTDSRASAGTSVAGSEEAAASGSPSVEVEPVVSAVQTDTADLSASTLVQTSPLPATPSAASPPPPAVPSPIVEAPVVPPPKPKELYDKAIQTADFSTSTRDDLPSSADPNSQAGGVGKEDTEELRARIMAELEEERKHLDAEIAEEKRKAELQLEEERARGLSQPALASVLASPPFLDFLNSSSKIVQRALSDSYDYLRDYTVSATDENADADGAKVRLLGSWYDDKWGRGRSVTDVDWSPKFPELFVASYNKSPMAVNEPDGIACVWNLHLKERPEFVFHAQSDVLSVCFTPFHPNIVAGGTYSGQILLWDTRSRHPSPVHKSPLSATGHTHPIYSLDMIGTQNAHNLVSASTDGTVCAWGVDRLAEPEEVLELLHPAHNKTDEVSITSLGFPDSDTKTFWVGTEEGNVYAANRHDLGGLKRGLVQTETYRGHSGPVTSIDFHPLAGAVDLSDLFLTSGVDWTVKLWKRGAAGTASAATEAGAASSAAPTSKSTAAKTVSPILSFEGADDYVYDARWHPHHPALFGTVDGAGKFDLWNLNEDTEIPIISTPVAPSASRGLNKLAWDRREGRRAAIGSSDGKVYIYEVAQELVTPKEGEWEQMRKTVNTALAANASAETGGR